MKIAILTFHRAFNCGAMLQAWALKTILERMGHDVEFPICNHVGETNRWIPLVDFNKKGMLKVRSFLGRSIINLMSFPNEDILRYRYKSFREQFLPERKCLAADLDKYYDLVIVGSDQIWSARHSTVYAPLFFCEEISGLIKKIAYAASYGDKPLDEESVKRVVLSLDRFSAVSVREPLAKKQLSNLSKKKIDVTLDPTLLLMASDYGEIATEPYSVNEPYLFMYTLSAEPFFVNTAKTLARRLGVKCVIAPCYQFSRFGAQNGITYGISPDRLVGWVRGAKYILAGSFHGTVMGVLFKKPFLSLRGQVDEYESRPAALLNMMGCGERLVTPKTSIEEMEALLRESVQVEAYSKLEQARSRSLDWLKQAISSDYQNIKS